MPTRSKSKSKHRANAATLPPSSTSPNILVNNLDTRHGLVSPNARVYTVLEIDSSHENFSATIWMPEVAMLSSSFAASQLVAISVCTPAAYASQLLDPLQVESLEKLCIRQFGILVKDGLKDEPGDLFVTASAWPCSKLKEGVRISRQLAYALGSPNLGTKICLSPINLSGLQNLEGSKFPGKTWMQVILQESQEISLRWCPVCRKVASNDDLRSRDSLQQCQLPSKSTLGIPSMADKQSPRHTGSAKTLLDNVGSLRKEASGALSGCNLGLEPTKKREVTHKKDEYWWLDTKSTLSSILVNENERAKVLLEKFCNRILQGRYLLKGNFVAIPVCGQTCIFQVVDGRCFPAVGLNVSNKKRSSKIEDAGSPLVFLAGRNTLVQLLPPVVQFPNFTYNHIHAEAAAGKPHGKVSEYAATVAERLECHAIGGLSEQIATLREIMEISLLHPEHLMRLGLQPPRGVLLHGPPGTGKTSLALTLAFEAGIKIYSVNGPEIIKECYGESEAALQAVFEAAQKSAPSVIFIDELDAIAPTRTEGSEDLEQRIVAALLIQMDGGGQGLHRVLVIGATNRVEAIDPALRRPGRFDREIEIGIPSPSGRLEILILTLQKMSHNLSKAEIEAMAAATHGFVGADLMALCNEAALVALRRYACKRMTIKSPPLGLQGFSYEQERSLSSTSEVMKVTKQFESLKFTASTNTEMSSNQDYSMESENLLLKITKDDFEEAKTKIRPSAMREVMLEVPKVHWSDIGGHEKVKQQLKEAVEWPQKYGDAFTRIGVHPPRGVLLYGPPGCSKTLMARAVATEAGLNFIAVKGPELFSKWVGQSEKAVQSLFKRARAASPSIVFFDELDGLAVTRNSTGDGVSHGDRVMSQLLVELDGLNSKKAITVIAATNRPDKIDPALLRPGRFDRLLYVGPPDKAARLQIFEIHTKKMPCGVDVDKVALAACTDGYTGADIASICREAAMAVLEEDLNAQEVKMSHFNLALSKVQPSASEVLESLYVQFSQGIQ